MPQTCHAIRRVSSGCGAEPVHEMPVYVFMVEPPRTIHMQGAWGATVQAERHGVARLPIDEAVELHESTLADMLAVRVAAWKQLIGKRTPSSIGTLPFTKRERRIMAMQGVRERSLVTPTATCGL
jgi:hypothetical protein